MANFSWNAVIASTKFVWVSAYMHQSPLATVPLQGLGRHQHHPRFAGALFQFPYWRMIPMDSLPLLRLRVALSAIVADQLKHAEAMRALALSRDVPTDLIDQTLLHLVARQRLLERDRSNTHTEVSTNTMRIADRRTGPDAKNNSVTELH
jgi:hypothetical protein